MTRLTPILLGLTFVMSVVALWLVLMLFITKPWDDAITEAELSEILQAAQETSKEEKEANRVAKCDSIERLLTGAPDNSEPLIMAEVFKGLIENNCLSSP